MQQNPNAQLELVAREWEAIDLVKCRVLGAFDRWGLPAVFTRIHGYHPEHIRSPPGFHIDLTKNPRISDWMRMHSTAIRYSVEASKHEHGFVFLNWTYFEYDVKQQSTVRVAHIIGRGL